MGLPILAPTYARLCEYDSLMAVHAAHERVTGDFRARADARAKIWREHPTMYETYLQAAID